MFEIFIKSATFGMVCLAWYAYGKWKAKVAYEIFGATSGAATFVIGDGKMEVKEGKDPEASAVVKMTDIALRKLIEGKIDALTGMNSGMSLDPSGLMAKSSRNCAPPGMVTSLKVDTAAGVFTLTLVTVRPVSERSLWISAA